MPANPFTDSLLSAYRHDTALAAQLSELFSTQAAARLAVELTILDADLCN